MADMDDQIFNLSDDPHAILKAAGVECPEFDVWYANESHEWQGTEELDAILALARLVAKYKTKLDSRAALTERALEISRTTGHSLTEAVEVLDMIARYQDEHHA